MIWVWALEPTWKGTCGTHLSFHYPCCKIEARERVIDWKLMNQLAWIMQHSKNKRDPLSPGWKARTDSQKLSSVLHTSLSLPSLSSSFFLNNDKVFAKWKAVWAKELFSFLDSKCLRNLLRKVIEFLESLKELFRAVLLNTVCAQSHLSLFNAT